MIQIERSLAAGLSSNIVPTTPARTLNTNFTPSATRPTLVMYSVEIGGTTTLLSGDDGVIELDVPAPPRAVGAAPARARPRVVQLSPQALHQTVRRVDIVTHGCLFGATNGSDVVDARLVVGPRLCGPQPASVGCAFDRALDLEHLEHGLEA